MIRLGKLFLTGVLIYVVVCGCVYIGMLQPPEVFSRTVATVPSSVLFATLPVESLWKFARAGRLHAGDPAPDFQLPSVDQTNQVQLSSHRGTRPVLLIFGSYT